MEIYHKTIKKNILIVEYYNFDASTIFMNFHIQTPARHMVQFSVLNYSFSVEYAMDSEHSKWIYA